MQELSLNILDITMNGITAGADTMRISIEEAYPAMTITIRDNGCGLNEETLDKLRDPFFTSRTTRKVGMGVPLFEMQAEMTGIMKQREVPWTSTCAKLGRLWAMYRSTSRTSCCGYSLT